MKYLTHRSPGLSVASFLFMLDDFLWTPTAQDNGQGLGYPWAGLPKARDPLLPPLPRKKNSPFHAVAQLPSHLCQFPDSDFSFTSQNCAWTREALLHTYVPNERLFYMAHFITNPWTCWIFVILSLGVFKVHFLPITSAMVSFLSTSFFSLCLLQTPTLFLNSDHTYYYLSLLQPLVS